MRDCLTHLDKTLRATRSPRSKKRTAPLTVAICFTGSNASPSLTCHSTLSSSVIGEMVPNDSAPAVQLLEDFVDEWLAC